MTWVTPSRRNCSTAAVVWSAVRVARFRLEDHVLVEVRHQLATLDAAHLVVVVEDSVVHLDAVGVRRDAEQRIGLTERVQDDSYLDFALGNARVGGLVVARRSARRGSGGIAR